MNQVLKNYLPIILEKFSYVWRWVPHRLLSNSVYFTKTKNPEKSKFVPFPIYHILHKSFPEQCSASKLCRKKWLKLEKTKKKPTLILWTIKWVVMHIIGKNIHRSQFQWHSFYLSKLPALKYWPQVLSPSKESPWEKNTTYLPILYLEAFFWTFLLETPSEPIVHILLNVFNCKFLSTELDCYL